MVRLKRMGFLAPFLVVVATLLGFSAAASAEFDAFDAPSIVHRIESANERLDMTVNTSRILTLDAKIPQAQINNPDILELTVLSPNQVQISAKKAGVTQVNLWDENDQIYTVDVIVYGDARELTLILKDEFPGASLRVKPITNGVLISGYVDQPAHIRSIIEIAEEFYPKVLDNIQVGGVHQVLLHVKVMEVSRTKLRNLGFDWAQMSGGSIVRSTISGLIAGAGAGVVATTGSETFLFNVIDGSDTFFGVLEALRQDNLMKVLAEPTLVTISGRPAYFQSGGEFPILVPQSLGTVSIEFKRFGTQVDFVPIVLGNGRIRLEVRPRVSEIDNTRSVTIGGNVVPGLRVREVETGVEMMAGQTLAIAGLVQTRVEAQRRALPWVGELPYLGALFRRVREENNEIELLIMVTPELVEAMDADQVPQCGPGMRTAGPNDWQLYMRGHIEVPNCCPAGPEAAAPADLLGLEGPGMILDERQPPAVPGTPEPAPEPVPPDSSAATARSAPDRPDRSLVRNNPSSRQSRTVASADTGEGLPGFIGPIGYDTAGMSSAAREPAASAR